MWKEQRGEFAPVFKPQIYFSDIFLGNFEAENALKVPRMPKYELPEYRD